MDAYEQLSYPGFAYAATHPARLEAIGRLFGLDSAPASSCRVLELGCGDGGNALSLAQTLPDARVLGIDASAGAIARGLKLARAATLENVELRCASFEDLPDELGSFDYIVAHGVYSWVPPAARTALLACCRDRLASSGIAFVSYNAYPGSHLRDMAREILRYHVRDIADPEARLAGAHELIRTMVAIEEPTPYARVLREQMQRMLRFSDALLFHDDLAEISTPFYFHEFMEQASGHGLRFVSEADLFESQMRDMPESAAELMRSLPDDVVVREQHLDFFKNRMFRQTLLCHAEAPVTRDLDTGAVERLALCSSARAQDQDGVFATPEGFSMTTSEPLIVAAMGALAEVWPAALTFPTLQARAVQGSRIEASRELVARRLSDVMLQAHLARIVQLHSYPPPVCSRPSTRPLASPLARVQSVGGSAVVSSLLHTNVLLEGELERELLAMLDGTRERAAVIEALLGATSVAAMESRVELESAVETALERFAAVGLLTQ